MAIFDDRLEVWSWGRLPGDLTPEKLRIDHPSVRRNELIAEVFYRRGYIEKWGRGTQKIIRLCQEGKLPEPDFLERAGEVGVRFWSATAAAGSEAALPRRQREVLKALAFLAEGTLEQIRARIESPPTSRMIQRILASLLDERRVLRTGKGRSTRYRLAQ